MPTRAGMTFMEPLSSTTSPLSSGSSASSVPLAEAELLVSEVDSDSVSVSDSDSVSLGG